MVTKFEPNGDVGKLKSSKGINSPIQCISLCEANPSCFVVTFNKGECHRYKRFISMTVKTTENLDVYIKGKILPGMTKT